MLSLASLVLLGGGIGDQIGTLKGFRIGVVLFVLASVACGVAGSVLFLVAARIIQGIGAAVLVPTSLALVSQAYNSGRTSTSSRSRKMSREIAGQRNRDIEALLRDAACPDATGTVLVFVRTFVGSRYSGVAATRELSVSKWRHSVSGWTDKSSRPHHGLNVA